MEDTKTIKTNSFIKAVFLVLSLCLCTIGNVSAQSASIVDTPAATAFIARNYQQALIEFNKLAEQYPNDLTIKRYQAICLDRLERQDEAVEILKQILLISTQAVSVHYHLGTIYYKLQQAQMAEQHFNEVISLSSSSKYEELAQVYLDAIANQRFNLLNPGAPRRWGVYAILGATHDLGSRRSFNGEDRSGTRSSGYLSANYYYLRNHQWTGTVGFSVFRSHHSNDNLSDNDFKQWGLRTTLQRQTKISNKPTTFRVSVDYKDLEFGSRDYSDGLSGSLNTRINLTRNTATNFYVYYGQDNFVPLLSFDPDLVVTRQDVVYAGVDHSVYFKNRTIELGSGAFATNIDADSDNFNRDGYGARVFARFALPYKLQLRLSATYRQDDYPDYIGFTPGDDSDRDFKSIYYGAGLSRQLSKHFSLNLTYRKYDVDYSRDFGDVDDSTLGMFLSYVY